MCFYTIIKMKNKTVIENQVGVSKCVLYLLKNVRRSYEKGKRKVMYLSHSVERDVQLGFLGP